MVGAMYKKVSESLDNLPSSSDHINSHGCEVKVLCLLSSRLQSENLNIKIYKTVILPVCLSAKLGLSQQGKNV
jgi:hypothetical protein